MLFLSLLLEYAQHLFLQLLRGLCLYIAICLSRYLQKKKQNIAQEYGLYCFKPISEFKQLSTSDLESVSP